MAARRRKVNKSQVSVRTVVTVTLTVLAVGTAVALAYLARVTLALILAAAIFAIALHRAVDFLRRHRVRRSLAIALVLTGFLGTLAGFGIIVIPAAVSQGRALVEQAPETLRSVRQSKSFAEVDRHLHIAERLQQLESGTGELVSSAVNPLIKVVGGVVTAVVGFVTLLFLIAFLLVFAEGLVRRILAEATAPRRSRYERVLGAMYRSVGGYLSGLLMICTTNAVLTTTFLAITRTPYFLPLGLLSGFSSLVPYLGPLVGGTLVTGTALLTGGLWRGVATAIYFVIYGQFEGNLLGPFIYRRTVDVNPLVTLLSVLIGGDVGGVPGAILAVPLAAAGQIILLEAVRVRRYRLDVPMTGDVAEAQRHPAEPTHEERH